MRSLETYHKPRPQYSSAYAVPKKAVALPMKFLVSHAIFPFVVGDSQSVQTQLWILFLWNVLVWLGAMLLHALSGA